jgi:uncharacterized membrane protein YbhN (UPF0104 family)
LAVAALGFFAGAVLSIRARPELVQGLAVLPVLGILLLGVPGTMLLNATEFRLTGRLVGQWIPYGRALETAVISSAANLLPLPGGSIVRVGALRAGGATLARGGSSTLFAGTVWVGVSLLYAGSALCALGRSARGAVFLGLGGAAMLAAAGLFAPLLENRRAAATLVGVRFVMIIWGALRLTLCLWTLGIQAGFAKASVLTVANAVASVVAIVPGGLGIREGTAASLGVLAGLDASSGFLAAAVNRLVALLLLAPSALVLSVRHRGVKEATRTAPEKAPTGGHD